MDLDPIFQQYLKDQQPAASVLAVMKYGWRKFVRFSAGVEEITPTVLEDFYKSLLWEPNEKGQWYKPNSVDQVLRRVRQVLRWAAAQGLLEQDPTVGLLLPRPLQPVPQRLNWESLQRLLNAPDQSTPMGLRDALLLQMLLLLPLNDVVALSLETVYHLELDAVTQLLLTEYLERGRQPRNDGEKTLFLGRGGDPLSAQMAVLRLNEMAKQAGLGRRLPTRVLRQSYQAALQDLRDRHRPNQKGRP